MKSIKNIANKTMLVALCGVATSTFLFGLKQASVAESQETIPAQLHNPSSIFQDPPSPFLLTPAHLSALNKSLCRLDVQNTKSYISGYADASAGFSNRNPYFFELFNSKHNPFPFPEVGRRSCYNYGYEAHDS